jgi:hypothetical protein
MKQKFFGRSKIDVEDPDAYKYLDPLWAVLRNTPDQGITADEMGKKSKLNPEKAVPMIQGLSALFQKKMVHVLVLGDLGNINPETWYEENLKNSWLFDKVMLLTMKINTGIPNEGWDSNPYMQEFKRMWMESQGV